MLPQQGGGSLKGVIVSLGDMPNVTAPVLDRLAQAFADAPDALAVVPTLLGQRGNPVFFDGALLASLADAPGGARGWLDAHPDSVMRITVAHAGFTTDLDTLADVAALSATPGAPVVDLP